MPSKCPICDREDRAEIENAILNVTADAPPNSQASIDAIAERFGVSSSDLKAHAMFHTPLIGDEDIQILEGSRPVVESGEADEAGANKPRDSLTRRVKLREADMLSAVGNEYLVTLKTLGRRINRLAGTSSIDVEDEDKQIKLAKLLTKPMVDLYVGLGGEIRQTVKVMAELDRQLNGPQDPATTGLAALAAAIRGSDTQE